MKAAATVNFKRRYDKKDEPSRTSIDKTLLKLVQNPRPPGLHCHRIRGFPGKPVWEAYINDEARLTFQYGDDCIILRNNCHHDQVLRSP
jgi:hypothetical protein